jgi:2-amino-4-hydroxy-6-hydroxymethyldihydropteridine diphosphokinase
MNEAYLCLGGNMGNCLVNLKQACAQIEQKAGKIEQYSSIYQSQAWGMNNAPDFYNQVIKLKTKLNAEEIMLVLLGIEKKMGRERTKQDNAYQNRIIDIDILFFNTEVIENHTLQIPHPRLHLRRFVLEPLHEIAPNHIHPILKKTVAQLLSICADNGQIKKSEHAA